jgi:hypothetical protein
MVKRPTPAEIYGKVNNAIQALKAGRRDFGTRKHWASDSADLGLNSASDLWNLLPVLLEEIRLARPENCYAGTRPPQRSYEDDDAISDEELWAFAWNSQRLARRMYLKFVLTKNRRGEWHYFHLDCHTDAPK